MLKTLATGFFLLVLSALPASAEPISMAIAAVGAVLKAGGIGAMLLKAAFGLALKAGLSLYEQAKQRRANRKKTNGVTLSVQMGDTVPRTYLIGTRATAGHRFYIGYWGNAGKTPNAFITDCVVLSCLPSRNGPQGLDAVYVGKRACTVLWSEPHEDGRGFPLAELRVSGVDYGWVKYLDGTQTVADPFLLAKFSGHSTRPYLPSMIGRGCQIAIITLRQNADLFNNQLQSCMFQPKPMAVYDPRKDTTAGGSGNQRWNDPATWQPSDNLPVLAYNIARGLYYRGRWVHGGRNFASYRLPASSWMAAANVADIMVNGARQYRGGLEVAVDSEPLDAIEDLRAGCSGRFSEVGGQIKFRCGSPGAAVYSFTDEQIVVTEDQGFEPFSSIKSSYNTATAVYPEPAELWAAKDAPEYAPSGLLTRDDGERLPMALELDAVPFSSQVQMIMKTALEEAQRWRVHEAFFGPEARALEPGDTINWTSEQNYYTGKDFEVVRITPMAGHRHRIVYRELDPADYDPPSVFIPTVTVPVGPSPIPPQIMGGWSVAPSSIDGRRPAILIGCDNDVDDVARVWVQVRLKSTGAVVFDSDSSVYAAPYTWLLSGAWCLSTTDYQVRGRYVPYSRRPTSFTAWLDVTTGVFADTDFTATLETIGDDVRAVFADIVKTLTSDVISMVENLGIAQSLTSAGGQLAREKMLAEVGTARAEILEERYVRATETEALSASYLAVAAQVASAAAAIITEQTARVTGDSALATSIQTVNAEYGGRFAGGLIKFEAAAAPSGVDARFAVLVRGGTSADYKVSGLYVDLYTVSGVQKSRVAVLTDQFVVTDGNDTSVPMVFESGQLKVTAARFGTVTSGVLQSPDGKMVINLAAGTIVVKS